MRIFLTVFCFFSITFGTLVPKAIAADHAAPQALGNIATEAAAAGQAAGEKAKEPRGLPPEAGRIHLGPLVITNSMLLTLCVAIGLALFAQLATRNIQAVPSGLQNFAEWMVGGLYGFFETILGAELVKKSFWFFGTLFILIMFTNWCGLIPGVGTIGYGHTDATGHFHLQTPLFRGGNADLNATSAMALIFFFFWTVWALQANGPVGLVKHIFASPSKLGGFMGLFISAIFLFVGAVEVVSILFRPVSLSFRLFGNVFAGENILESLMSIHPVLGFIAPLPFYFLELLVGIVQALVFALLTAVFTALICQHSGDHGPEHGKEHGHGHAHGKAHSH